MKLIANAYYGPHNSERKEKPAARIFKLSESEKSNYNLAENFIVTDLIEVNHKPDYESWLLLSKANKNCSFYMPVYTLREACKNIEASLHYNILTSISLKCLGMSADVGCGRLSNDEIQKILLDTSSEIVINKTISFEFLVDHEELMKGEEYNYAWTSDTTGN